jgi:hypothetical protein
MGRYLETETARRGERVVVGEPFPVTIDLDDLVP